MFAALAKPRSARSILGAVTQPGRKDSRLAGKVCIVMEMCFGCSVADHLMGNVTGKRLLALPRYSIVLLDNESIFQLHILSESGVFSSRVRL